MSEHGGSLVPGFHSLEVLRRGAESTVYRALRETGDERVVLKVMRGANGTGEVERLRELSGLPGVVHLVDDGLTSSGRPFAALAHLPEGDYGTALRDRAPLPVEEVVEVGRAVAGALEAVHALGLLHHAVEPDNLLVSGEGAVLADAGAVLPAEAVPPEVGLDTDALRYAPPEALRGEPHSAASDVYRLAATLWTLLAGHAPFDGDPGDPFGQRERVLTGAPPSLPRDDVPATLEGVLLQALSKSQGERFSTAGALAEALDTASLPAAAPVPVVPPAPEAQPDTGAETSPAAFPADPGTDDASQSGAEAPEPMEAAWWEADDAPFGEEAPPVAEGLPANDALSVDVEPPDALSAVGAAPSGHSETTESAWWEVDEEASEGGVSPNAEASPVDDAPSADDEPSDALLTVGAESTESAWWEVDDEDFDAQAAERLESAWWDEAKEPSDHAPETGEVQATAPDGGAPAADGFDHRRTDRFGPEVVAASRIGRDDRSPAPAPAPARGGDPWGGLDDGPGPATPEPPRPFLPDAGNARRPAPPVPRVRATPLPNRLWPRYAAIGVAAVVVLAAVVAVAVVVLRPGSAQPNEAASSPPPADDASNAPPASVIEEGAPTGVELADSGDAVVVSWEDNTGGEASHHVVGGPFGSVPAPLGEVVPGETEVAVRDLEAAEDYCFTVIAVLSVDEVAYSDQACTTRDG